MDNRRLTIVLPCYQRPERTKRMIECIFNQTIDDWEAFIIGDNCDNFKDILDSDWYAKGTNHAEERGNKIITYNSLEHHGGYGYNAINNAIKFATGKYFIFGGNDDIIRSTHFEHYLSGIEGSGFDFAYYNTWVDPHKMLRISQPMFGAIGHSELIVRTAFLKTVEPHTDKYGHDWEFIQNMMRKTKHHIKVSDESPTYFVMSVPGKTLDTID
jgi:glycosyltransferase involved in cell wall biosynthesis